MNKEKYKMTKEIKEIKMDNICIYQIASFVKDVDDYANETHNFHQILDYIYDKAEKFLYEKCDIAYNYAWEMYNNFDLMYVADDIDEVIKYLSYTRGLWVDIVLAFNNYLNYMKYLDDKKGAKNE